MSRTCAGCAKPLPLMAHWRTRWCGPKCRDKAKNDSRRRRARAKFHAVAELVFVVAMIAVACTAGAL